MNEAEVAVALMLLRNKPNFSYVIVEKDEATVKMTVKTPKSEDKQ